MIPSICKINHQKNWRDFLVYIIRAIWLFWCAGRLNWLLSNISIISIAALVIDASFFVLLIFLFVFGKVGPVFSIIGFIFDP
ncbi:hypothetical protein BDD12DRAFT_816002 [Trichophaea hybrida]|nr:hypothetical protein BDD12DRAFT_816002 [Trichophaea hybrida]